MAKLARVFLVIAAALHTAVGLSVLANPYLMEAPGVVSTSLTGVTTIRTWGALFLGAGISGLFMALFRGWVLPGLILVTTIGCTIFATRVIGLSIDGVEPRQWIELRREAVGFVSALIGLVCAMISRKGHSKP